MEVMITTHDRVIEEALSLPTDIRLSLIEKLLMSLNRPVDEENNLLWADEAQRRIAQLEEGNAKLVSGEEVFAKIRGKQEERAKSGCRDNFLEILNKVPDVEPEAFDKL